MNLQKLLALALAIAASFSPCAAAEKDSPPSVLATSVGNSVVVADPVTGRAVEFDTGPVGWLYPGPGGVLFAPDVINGRTTVINLRSLSVVDRLDGLTMPHFGENPDRYVALAGEVIIVSYPERAVIATVPAEIANPWQVIIAPDDAAALILERLPDGSTGVHMSTVNLITRQIVYRRPLAGDIVHMALSPQLGILALADLETNRIRFVEPATLSPMADHPVDGRPLDVVFTFGGKTMATALETADGAGVLELAHFKSGKKGIELKKEHTIALPAVPVRIAGSPRGDRIAVALDNGTIAVVDVDKREIVATAELPGTARDLRWCDLTREGPMIPEWTDGEPTELDFGPFAPKVRDEKSSGLEEPSWIKPPN